LLIFIRMFFHAIFLCGGMEGLSSNTFVGHIYGLRRLALSPSMDQRSYPGFWFLDASPLIIGHKDRQQNMPVDEDHRSTYSVPSGNCRRLINWLFITLASKYINKIIPGLDPISKSVVLASRLCGNDGFKIRIFMRPASKHV